MASSSHTIRSPQYQAVSGTLIDNMPSIDPIFSPSNFDAYQHQEVTEPHESSEPALVLFSSQPTEEECNNLLFVTKNAVILRGSAAVGTIGPVVGKMDIGENDDTYIFRVSLPGVAREGFSWDVASDGKVSIKGVTVTGESVVYSHSMRFEMQSQNLCPAGHFSISFNLPGPVDPQDLSTHFDDGVFECVVKKRTPPAN